MSSHELQPRWSHETYHQQGQSQLLAQPLRSSTSRKAFRGRLRGLPQRVTGIKERAKSDKFKEHFSQAQLFYNSLSEVEKSHVLAALSFELDHCDEAIVYERLTGRLADVDLILARSIAEMVGSIKPETSKLQNHGKTAPGLSQMDYLPSKPTIASRRIGILIADGYDALAFNAIVGVIKGAQALPLVIGRKRSPIFALGEDSSNSKGVTPDHHLEGQRSTMFDALVNPGGTPSIKTLSANGRTLHYVREAFGHLKPIAATGKAVDFVQKAVQLPQVQLSNSHEVQESYGVVTLRDVKPEGLGEVVNVVKEAKGFLEKFIYAVSQHRCWDRELDVLAMLVAF